MMATFRTLTDRSGESIAVQYYQGCYFSRAEFPIPFKDHMSQVKDMDMREDDVLVYTYPKSGTHWLWEIVTMIVNEDLEYRERIRGMDMLDFSDVKILHTTLSPRVIAAHVRFRFLPNDVFNKKPKLIFVLRHPKSVAVSFYNMTVGMKGLDRHGESIPVKHYNGKFEDYLELFMAGEVPYGSWFEHVLEFEKYQQENSDLPILVLHFEDMTRDAVTCIRRISEFLGKRCDLARAKAVADACSFDKMKQMNAGTIADGIDWRDKDSNIFRKGSTTDWKSWFTVAQSEMFDSVLKSKMSESRFLHRYVD